MPQHHDLESTAAETTRRRIVVATACLATMIVATWALPVKAWLALSSIWIATHPIAGSIAYLASFVVLTVAMVPGSLLILCGGYLFGLQVGLPLAWLGVGLGAGAVAIVTRTVARGWLLRRYADDPRFRAIDNAVAGRGFTLILLSRMSLLMPFNLLNVIYGLSRVRLLTLTVATWLGMTPAVVLYAWLGSVAQDIDQVFASGLDDGPSGGLLIAGSVIVVLIVTWLIHRTATAQLKRELGDEDS